MDNASLIGYLSGLLSALTSPGYPGAQPALFAGSNYAPFSTTSGGFAPLFQQEPALLPTMGWNSGQFTPVGFPQQAPGFYPQMPFFIPQSAPWMGQPGIMPPSPAMTTAFSPPVIIQNQINSMPLGSSGYLNASMSVGTTLGVGRFF